ncbi:hypothetical protein RQP46_001308 [Phenoliferia psychrophenolica]
MKAASLADLRVVVKKPKSWFHRSKSSIHKADFDFGCAGDLGPGAFEEEDEQDGEGEGSDDGEESERGMESPRMSTTLRYTPSFAASVEESSEDLTATVPSSSSDAATLRRKAAESAAVDALEFYFSTTASLSSPTSPPSTLPISSQDVLLDELESRIDSLPLPAIDHDLASSLAQLLACIERLLAISLARVKSQPPSSPQLDRQHRHREEEPPAAAAEGVYATLEREARALQRDKELWTRNDADQLVGHAREVEMAERDLLWGRVDDLSERVGVLCRTRADLVAAAAAATTATDDTAAQGEEGQEKRAEWAREAALFEEAHPEPDLPRYSTDHHPPAYATATTTSADWEKPPLSPSTVPGSRTTSHAATSEKMALDLDSVSLAIERLYRVSPQLSNQRVDPSTRRVVREHQLAKLGNAIERLSRGRLDDQRAAPSPTGPLDASEEEYKRVRLQKRQDVALDRLIAQIDRAASRTLTDQRVDLAAMTITKRAGKEREKEQDERERRDFILHHTGKGRLASQDASFSSGIVERFPRAPSPSEPVTITEFFKTEASSSTPSPSATPPPPPPTTTTTTNSDDTRTGAFPVLRKTFSARGSLFQEANNSGSSSPSWKAGSRLAGVFRRNSGAGLGGMSRTASADARLEPESAAAAGGLSVGVVSGMTRSASLGVEVHSVLPLDFIAEESRNLGTLVLTFWPRKKSSSPSPPYTVLEVQPLGLLVAPTTGGPASLLPLPSRVDPSQPLPPLLQPSPTSTYYEAKLTTLGQSSPTSPERSRPDLEVHHPLPTADLRSALPTSFACAKCETELVDAREVVKYNALPSEHWAELLDAWMCHQDQTLSDDLVAKGKGIKPRVDEALVGASYVLFGRDRTKNWITPEKSEQTRTETDDVLLPAHCVSCNSLIGQHVLLPSSSPADPFSDPPTSFVRILKYATYATSSSTGAALPRYSLASHLSAQLLEIAQAHACHRFVIEDAKDSKPRLLLWLFNPAVRVSFSSAHPSTALLQDQSSSSSSSPSSSPTPQTKRSSMAALLASGDDDDGPFPLGRAMNAVKVFYLVVDSNADEEACRDFMDAPHSTPEHVAYPQDVVERLERLLRASTAVYPEAKRMWGAMQAGFLERL